MLTLKDVLQEDLCAGCGFCESATQGAAAMEYSDSGFLRPSNITSLDSKEKERIQAVCPGVHGHDVVSEQSYKAPNVHYLWGEYYSCGVGYSTDDNIRFVGSSGGAITQICTWLLETGRVKAVLVTDYDLEDKLKTTSKLATTPKDVIACSGSKYAPSSPLRLLSQLKNIDGPVAIVGKPCDITAVRRAMNANDELVGNTAVLISFFCAGVPSDKQNEKLVYKLGVSDRSDLASFKHRGNGWPGKTVAVTVQGQSYECTYSESWGKTLNKDLQFRCKICPDGIGESADIVCADAWYGEGGYPSFEEADGRSLIMSRTGLGHELIKRSVSDGKLHVEQLDPNEIGKMQPGQLKRRKVLAIRILALKTLRQKIFTINKSAVKAYGRGVGLRVAMQAYLGAVKRFLKKNQ